MARAALAQGQMGKIGTKQRPNGSWRAWAQYGDVDGVTRPISGYGATQEKAIADLKAKAQQRKAIAGEDTTLTPSSKLADLLDLWFEEIEAEGGRRAQSIERYRHAAKVIRAPRTGIGSVRIQACTTGKVDKFLKSIGRDRPALARLCKVVLQGAFGMAVRHGIVAVNPVREVSRIRSSSKPIEVLDRDQRIALRARVRAWEAGERMPEDARPRQRGGQPRARGLVDVMDLALATGCRIGELLALRWADVSDLDGECPTITVAATMVDVAGKLVRQTSTKTDAGWRVLTVPPFGVEVLKRLRDEQTPDPTAPVLPSQTGGHKNPHNFNRQWREARGTEFAWVTGHTFRKTVLTTIDREVDYDATRAQAGHSIAGDGVTRRHYVARATVAPDLRDVLEPLGDRPDAVTDLLSAS
ncbi:tyrosine-type recombinase/integrase [Skermania sp. ID1734]|uniref:tyrosine-type recombinase/integrase n=1 Tax=Skermania sp. ID1734 TaxID=2597516 RepID=UPI00117C846B|nr:site-specific integrase [Skermania sp. ID1734]TSD99966.1 tyrosine-type recombinase/integrase [Skermania sp. ID1734]